MEKILIQENLQGQRAASISVWFGFSPTAPPRPLDEYQANRQIEVLRIKNARRRTGRDPLGRLMSQEINAQPSEAELLREARGQARRGEVRWENSDRPTTA